MLGRRERDVGRGQGGGRAIPVVCMPAADVTPLSAGPFMARVREAFAGVRSATPADDEAQQDLTCCAYGRSCAIFRDDAAAALFNTGQHLQSWLGSGNVTVDRYDVRLLLHDAGQLGTTGKHTASASETAEEEEIEIERYRDLYPVQTPAASPEPEAESIFTETSVDASTANTAATQQYSAVAFDYGSSGSTTVLPVEEPAPAPAPPIVPDTPFVPQFAVPESIKGHMPSTERMHKTAKYVRQSGGQTEFVLRVKQAKNPNFGFLEPHSLQHPYFRWLVSTKPEEMIVIDAAPAAAEEDMSTGTELDASSQQDAPPQSAVNESTSTPYGPHLQPSQPEEQTNQVADPSQPGQHDQGTSHSDAEQAQTGAAAAVPLAAVSATAATVTKPPAQRPTLPIADMAALARRIGSSAAASTSHAGAATSQAMSMQPLASHMGHAPSFSDASGGAAVPAELQAIIQKLVAFIKKAGPRFEATVRAKEKANPKFAFLLPWNQHHWYYKQQLVSHLGQATADEVFALRANTPAPLTKPPASQPTAAELAAKQSAVPSEQTDAPATAQHASQQVADTHNAKPTSVVADSQSAESAVQATPQQASSPTANDTNVIGAEAVKPEPAVIPKNAPATAPPTVSSAQRKTAGKPIVASVPSNPRFAPRPVAPESGAMEPQAVAKEVDRAPEGMPQVTAVPEVQAEEAHAAHAAPGSLEAVMEAQNALLTERQQQPQLAVSQEELQTQRRKLVRQMLEAKQKAAAETEEQKRQKQQAAIAKYRQAFASDTEEEVIHIVEEDDPEHEPLEPGEWVEEPEEKPAPAPVLTVAQRGALPSLEDLIKPRQDLVPHQRVFPLPRPASPNQQRDARAEVAPASPSTSGRSHTLDSTSDDRHRRRHKRKRSRRRDTSSGSCSDSTSDSHKQKRHRHKQKRSKSSKRKFKEAFKEAFKKAAKSRKGRKSTRRRSSKRSRSHSASSSESSGRGYKQKRSRAVSDDDRSDDNAEAGANSADALRAKVRAMLGSL